MKTRLATKFLLLLAGIVVAFSSAAQQPDESANSVAPDLASLQSDWWNYFEGSQNEVEFRIDVFLEGILAQTADLEVRNQEIATSILAAVRDNFTAYLALADVAALTLEEQSPPALGYSITVLLELAEAARGARSDAAEEQLEVEREQRVLNGASRRRDTAFKDYVDATVGDERWLVALRLVQARTALEISARRLTLLTQRFERATEFAESTAMRVDLARGRLETTANEATLNELDERVRANELSVESAQDRLRAAQIAASGLDLDTVQGRSQQRLWQQRLLESEISLAVAEVALARSFAQYWWTRISLDRAPSIETIEERTLAWSELIRTIGQQAPEWKRESEEELIAVQSSNRDGLDRASRRLLDQRLGTAQEALAHVGELDAAISDLQLLMLVLDSSVTEYSGAIRSFLADLNRLAKTAYLRVASLVDATLFSVGETPVTGADILKALIIMAVAMLLSRGVRHAIGRVGDSEYTGTQASLYTVGRLTHYVIIVSAVFIALTSIGLDFGNLALVAGALSVGIGFGLQSIVNNFVSGLIILFEHSLRVGDYIELDTGLTGTVKAINVRSTLINTNDNIDIVVPNSEFVTTRLTNWTLGERVLRVRIPFGVAYGSDKEMVRKAAMEAAADVPFTLTHIKGREPDAWLIEFGDNSLNFLLLVWVNRQGAKRPTRTRAAYLWALETKLSEYGIEIPFPQRDIHLRSGWPTPTTQADKKSTT